MYKEASRLKLKFATAKGNLTVDQLWDLSIEELDNLAVTLDTLYKESGKKSFIDKKSEKDKTTKLRFDIVLDILNTKQEAAEKAQVRAENKEKNKKIIELIQSKKDKSLEGKSIKELEKMLVEEDGE